MLVLLSMAACAETAAADGSQSDGPKWRDSSVLSAGISAGATSAIIACLELPSEVVRLRMQAGASAHMGFGQQLRQALADMHRIGGWTYLAPCLAKEVPQDATEFAAYGKLTRTWNAHMPANVQEVPGAEWLIGAGAGASSPWTHPPAALVDPPPPPLLSTPSNRCTLQALMLCSVPTQRVQELRPRSSRCQPT